jgi:hypothetical protein
VFLPLFSQRPLGWRLRLFETFGTNSLAANFLHGMVSFTAELLYCPQSP